MSFSISTDGVRTSSAVTVPITYNIGDLPTIGNDTSDSFYLPVTFKDFAVTPFTLAGQTLVAGGAVFTPSAIDFSNIRVGDVVTAVTGGTVTLPVPATFTRTAHVYHSQNFIVLTGTNTLPKDGDSISGTGIGTGAVVTRVDTANRTVYLSVLNTESSVLASPITITVTPLVRVLTVNSTSRIVTLNANFGGTGTTVSGTITFTPTTFDPVAYYLECIHTTSTDKLNVTIKAYLQDGKLAYDANGTGTDTTSLSTTSATPGGAFFLNTDTYFTNARKPKTSI